VLECNYDQEVRVLQSPKNHVVYEEILSRLVTARYRFGESISVRALADEMGASRQPIMTALNSLAADGFVRITPQVGCEVINPSTQEMADFYQMFGRLEGLLAELAATRRTESQLTALKHANQQIRDILLRRRVAGDEYRLLNREFHTIVHQMASSPLLNARQSTIFATSDFFIVQTAKFSTHMVDAAEEHDAIISAIKSRRPDLAREAAERHIAGVAKVVLRNCGDVRPIARRTSKAGARG
jgi:DNA-binding GntR family transcriptional regulator